LDEFVPQKTAVYISQNDLHVAQMTVRETLDFSARCQGTGTRYGNILYTLSHSYINLLLNVSKKNNSSDGFVSLGFDVCCCGDFQSYFLSWQGEKGKLEYSLKQMWISS
jgi:hypothetical protein